MKASQFIGESTVRGWGNVVYFALLILTATTPALARHLPATHPLVVGGDHSHENHAGHDHSGVIAPQINLSSANLSCAPFIGLCTNLSGAHLSSANLSFADVTGANLTGADLELGDIRSANFTGANLTSADLLGAALGGANFTNADLTGANLTFAILSISRLENADLTSANLTSADLRNASLIGANLTSANLENADVRQSRLIGANFENADLTSADLSGADFTNAILTGANLHQAKLANLISSIPSLPVIPDAVVSVDSQLDVSGHTTVARGGVLVINTASFTTAALDLQGGIVVAPAGYGQHITGYGSVAGDVSGAAGITISASGGPLTLGDVGSTTGFDFAGTLNVGSSSVVLLDANQANLGTLTRLAAGGELTTVNGAALGSGNRFTATGSATVNGNFTNQGTVNGPSGAGKLTFTDVVNGAGSYTGNITFSDGFSPGNSPAKVTFDGNLTFGPNHTLLIELAGTTPGSEHDQLSIAETVSLNGTLQLEPIRVGFLGYRDPSERGEVDHFTILEARSRTGTFDEVINDDELLMATFGPNADGSFQSHVGGGLFRSITYTNSSVGITNYLALPGDANADGSVNATDLNALALNWRDSGITWPGGDFTEDGVVNAADLNLLALNWRSSIDVAAAPAVPEPASTVVLVVGLAGVACMRRWLATKWH